MRIPRLVRNDHGAVARRHQLAFSVAHYQSNQIIAGLYVEAGFHGDAGVIEALQRRIAQLHLQDFFTAGDIVAVLVENDSGQSQVVVISVFDLPRTFFAHVLCLRAIPSMISSRRAPLV